MIWDITDTIGFELRTASWRGGGTYNNNEFVPIVFNLTTGLHELIIRGREVNVLLDQVSVLAYVVPPTNTPGGPTNTPTRTPTVTLTAASTLTPTRTPTTGPSSPSATPTRTPTASTAGIVWSADMETGDLSQWLQGGVSQASYDSGSCIRPSTGVTTEQAHSGSYSMKMTVALPPESGCRQFRSVESKTNNTYYYSAWLNVPVFTRATNYWNVFQFKSNHCNTEEPFWVVDLMSRSSTGPMYLRLRYKGGNEEVAGPFQGDPVGSKYYGQTLRDVTPGQWTHIEAYLRQSTRSGSNDFTGRITVWQDGVQLWDMNNVITKYPPGFAGCSTAGDQRWSINNYSDALLPQPATLYWDDAVVSTTRVGP